MFVRFDDLRAADHQKEIVEDDFLRNVCQAPELNPCSMFGLVL
jgi:hypothetical protein